MHKDRDLFDRLYSEPSLFHSCFFSRISKLMQGAGKILFRFLEPFSDFSRFAHKARHPFPKFRERMDRRGVVIFESLEDF